jgi:excinuclease ABC subunit B
LDLPEVALVGILDADKEGFLRSTTSLIQTCGRAARNVEGKVIMYADKETDSMRAAIGEMSRRREKQKVWNAQEGIVPQTIIKPVRESLEALYEMDYVEVAPPVDGEGRGKKKKGATVDEAWTWEPAKLRGEIAKARADMLQAATELRFEDAAKLRDRVEQLQSIELKR